MTINNTFLTAKLYLFYLIHVFMADIARTTVSATSEPQPRASSSPSSSPTRAIPSDVRRRLRNAGKSATGLDPYSWQLDLGVAVKNGLDVLCPSGNG